MTREQKKAQRAQALLDAAWAAFCELGYEKLTIEDVADRAGYSRQPVYTLFGDKQNLIFELQSRATRQVVDLLFAHLRPGASLRENLTRVAQVVASELGSNHPTYGEQLFIVAQAIALNRPDIADKVRAQARWVIDDIARVIQRSPLARGEKLRSQPETIAAHLAAHINGLTTVQYQTGKRYASARELTEIFLFFALE
ncbi:MAG TPA: TetR/AcrR family transcriptional regulator [Nevskiaceae bacterium]|nr:TetR/AcrR family transcriptional regulator [Nevskiaceae bacterium]